MDLAAAGARWLHLRLPELQSRLFERAFLRTSPQPTQDHNLLLREPQLSLPLYLATL